MHRVPELAACLQLTALTSRGARPQNRTERGISLLGRFGLDRPLCLLSMVIRGGNNRWGYGCIITVRLVSAARSPVASSSVPDVHSVVGLNGLF